MNRAHEILSFLIVALLCSVGALWSSVTVFFFQIFPGSGATRFNTPESFVASGLLWATGWSLLCAAIVLPSVGSLLHRAAVAIGASTACVFAVLAGPPIISLPLVRAVGGELMHSGLNPIDAIEGARKAIAEVSAGWQFAQLSEPCEALDQVCMRAMAARAQAAGDETARQWLVLWASLSVGMAVCGGAVGYLMQLATKLSSEYVQRVHQAFAARATMQIPTKTLVIVILGALGGLVIGFAAESMGGAGVDLSSWLSRIADLDYYWDFSIPSPLVWGGFGVLVALAITWLLRAPE